MSQGTLVHLDGTGSADPDGDALGYTWAQVQGPDVTGGAGSLSGSRPQFLAPAEVSTLVFELRVDDGHGQSDPATVQVNVLEDVNAAVFVSGDTGDDASGNGTIERPFASIGRALAVISGAQEDVYVMARADGSRYAEAGAALAVPPGTSLYGGYDAGWRRDPAAHKTAVRADHRGIRIEGAVDFDTWISGFDLVTASSPGPGEDVTGVAAAGGTAMLHLRDNEIAAGDVAHGFATAPGSSYGVQLHDLAGVEILDDTIRAGRGGRGAGGEAGAAGQQGANGANASGNGRASGGSSSSGGGSGGKGGQRGGGPGGDGGSGANGDFASDDRGIGGAGGNGSGKPGKTGVDGVDGATGDAGAGVGSLSMANVFQPGRGQDGASGKPGGGGGGGGGGGASVGVWLVGVARATIERSTVVAGGGGEGGPAGVGGPGKGGGAGGRGAGGDCVTLFGCGSAGAPGGAGGLGGSGGAGGSGGGGPSFGVYVGPDIAPSLLHDVVSAGDGGDGGSSASSTGEGGASYAIFDADPRDGHEPLLLDNELTAGTPGAGGMAGNQNF